MISRTAETIAVIPARGGSKGIPGKNLVDVAGRPLLAWSIEAAFQANSAMRVIVTTDSEAIASVAHTAGAEVVKRPQQWALDDSPTEPGLLHALDAVEAVDTGTVLRLQPTSPFRLAGTLDRALETYKVSGCDSLVGVVEESPFLWRGPVDHAVPEYDLGNRPRRQDFVAENARYRECGSLYICTVGGLRQSANRLHGRVGLFVMDPREGTDIDTEYDLSIARGLMQTLGWGISSDHHS